jgi:hypothetical protein
MKPVLLVKNLTVSKNSCSMRIDNPNSSRGYDFVSIFETSKPEINALDKVFRNIGRTRDPKENPMNTKHRIIPARAPALHALQNKFPETAHA